MNTSPTKRDARVASPAETQGTSAAQAIHRREAGGASPLGTDASTPLFAGELAQALATAEQPSPPQVPPPPQAPPRSDPQQSARMAPSTVASGHLDGPQGAPRVSAKAPIENGARRAPVESEATLATLDHSVGGSDLTTHTEEPRRAAALSPRAGEIAGELADDNPIGIADEFPGETAEATAGTAVSEIGLTKADSDVTAVLTTEARAASKTESPIASPIASSNGSKRAGRVSPVGRALVVAQPALSPSPVRLADGTRSTVASPTVATRTVSVGHETVAATARTTNASVRLVVTGDVESAPSTATAPAPAVSASMAQELIVAGMPTVPTAFSGASSAAVKMIVRDVPSSVGRGLFTPTVAPATTPAPTVTAGTVTPPRATGARPVSSLAKHATMDVATNAGSVPRVSAPVAGPLLSRAAHLFQTSARQTAIVATALAAPVTRASSAPDFVAAPDAPRPLLASARSTVTAAARLATSSGAESSLGARRIAAPARPAAPPATMMGEVTVGASQPLPSSSVSSLSLSSSLSSPPVSSPGAAPSAATVPWAGAALGMPVPGAPSASPRASHAAATMATPAAVVRGLRVSAAYHRDAAPVKPKVTPSSALAVSAQSQSSSQSSSSSSSSRAGRPTVTPAPAIIPSAPAATVARELPPRAGHRPVSAPAGRLVAAATASPTMLPSASPRSAPPARAMVGQTAKQPASFAVAPATMFPVARPVTSPARRAVPVAHTASTFAPVATPVSVPAADPLATSAAPVQMTTASGAHRSVPGLAPRAYRSASGSPSPISQREPRAEEPRADMSPRAPVTRPPSPSPSARHGVERAPAPHEVSSAAPPRAQSSSPSPSSPLSTLRPQPSSQAQSSLSLPSSSSAPSSVPSSLPRPALSRSSSHLRSLAPESRSPPLPPPVRETRAHGDSVHVKGSLASPSRAGRAPTATPAPVASAVSAPRAEVPTSATMATAPNHAVAAPHGLARQHTVAAPTTAPVATTDARLVAAPTPSTLRSPSQSLAPSPIVAAPVAAPVAAAHHPWFAGGGVSADSSRVAAQAPRTDDPSIRSASGRVSGNSSAASRPVTRGPERSPSTPPAGTPAVPARAPTAAIGTPVIALTAGPSPTLVRASSPSPSRRVSDPVAIASAHTPMSRVAISDQRTDSDEQARPSEKAPPADRLEVVERVIGTPTRDDKDVSGLENEKNAENSKDAKGAKGARSDKDERRVSAAAPSLRAPAVEAPAVAPPEAAGVPHRPAFLDRGSSVASHLAGQHAAVAGTTPSARAALPWSPRAADAPSTSTATAHGPSPSMAELSTAPALSPSTAAATTQAHAAASAASAPSPFDGAFASLPLAPPPPAAAPSALFAYAADDLSLHATVMPERAMLSVDTGAGGELQLHLRVKDGVADVRVAGAAAESLDMRPNELRAALAGEGLTLGSFESGQSPPRQGTDIESRDDGSTARAPSRPAPGVAGSSGAGADKPSTWIAGRGVHITA